MKIKPLAVFISVMLPLAARTAIFHGYGMKAKGMGGTSIAVA